MVPLSSHFKVGKVFQKPRDIAYMPIGVTHAYKTLVPETCTKIVTKIVQFGWCLKVFGTRNLHQHSYVLFGASFCHFLVQVS